MINSRNLIYTNILDLTKIKKGNKTEHNNKAIVKFEGNEIRKLTVNDKDYFIAKGVFV